jgi:hypothetical protein
MLKKILGISLVFIFAIAAACPESRPTKLVRVCLVSDDLAGPFCPAEAIAERRFFVEPRPGEPVAPAIPCRVHGDPDPLVSVDVCAVSLLALNPYCPGEITIEVRSSALPLAPCPVHKAPPDPVIEKAKYPLFVFIPELLVAEGDLNAFCKSFRAAGGWGVRFFLLQSWSTVRLVPWERAIYNGREVRLYSAADGVNCPVTDMSRPNAVYWSRLRTVLSILKANDLEALVALGDNCSMNTRMQKLSYPFLASFQTMSREEVWPYLDPAEAFHACTASAGGLYGPAKYDLYREWTAEAIAELKLSGVAYRVEIQNEFSRLGWEATAPDPKNWYSTIVSAVLSAGVQGGRIVHSGDVSIVLNYPGIYSIHQIERPGLSVFPCAVSRIMLSGDGGYAGNFKGRSTTDIDVLGHKGLSIEDAVGIAREIRARGIAGGYEWMPRRAWRFDDCLANVDGIPMDVPKAIAAEWKK